jgi:hypothetical protein
MAGVVAAVHTPEAPHGGRRASAHCLAPHPTLDPARVPGEEGADREGEWEERRRGGRSAGREGGEGGVAASGRDALQAGGGGCGRGGG